ncbi:hypothetical protein HFC66_00255 [Escherichia coli]|nr:hypothetical protein [Escherichia coli]QIV68517.1 hypothetical protein HFC67_09405 [Escherichia coli]QIV73030.1 hypothetical protein HFC66_00255 [Escherichia coli]
MRAEIALMSGSAFAVTHHAFSSGAGRTSDGNGSHASTLKSPSYTKSVSWQHYRRAQKNAAVKAKNGYKYASLPASEKKRIFEMQQIEQRDKIAKA